MSIQDRLSKLNVDAVPELEIDEAREERSSGPLTLALEPAGEDQLVLGLVYEGKRYKNIIVKKYDGDAKSEAFRKDARKNSGKLLTYVLAQVIVQIGPFSREVVIGESGEAAWLEIIKQLSNPDSEHALLLSLQKTTKRRVGIELKCDNTEAGCDHEFEARVSVDDIKVFYPEKDLLTDESGRYLFELKDESGDTPLDVLLAIPNRLDSEQIAASYERDPEKNDMKAQLMLWDRMLRHKVGSRTSDISYFRKLDSDSLEEFMRLLSTELPGPQRWHLTQCPSCEQDLLFQVPLQNFLSQDQKTSKKKTMDRMKSRLKMQ